MGLWKYSMNKQATWNDCLYSSAAEIIVPDIAKAKSLIKVAKGRVDFIENIEIIQKSANYIFENYYSSVLELLHAKLLIDGLKVANHICIAYYLRDNLNESKLFRQFDNCRYKRNSLIYYGRMMDFNTAKEAIYSSKKLIKNIQNKLLK
mgnify:CR=1 FL=1